MKYISNINECYVTRKNAIVTKHSLKTNHTPKLIGGVVLHAEQNS